MALDPPGSRIPPVELRLFGALDIRVHGEPMPPLSYRKELHLLGLLALRHDRDLRRDVLAFTFWPDTDESLALNYLRRSLFHLRRALGTEGRRLLSPTPRTLRLDLSDAWTDFLVFDRAVRSLDETPDKSLEEAVGLYRGPLLAELVDEWAISERETRAQAYLAALETLARRCLERAEPAAAARWLRRALAADPRRESAACSLMEALAESGDRAALAEVYRELRERLHRDLNVEPAPETEALYHRLSRQAARPAEVPSAPSPPSPSTRRHLPVPLSDLIGRRDEIEELTGRMDRTRLLTLTGFGGVGKTRLAIALAESLLERSPGGEERFADGAWFVDLAPVADPALVLSTIARSLGVAEEGDRPIGDSLSAFLSSRSLLMVLDNCEHLLDGCASAAAFLLAACPDLRIVATSRQPLGLSGEQVWRVPSLSIPAEPRDDPDADPDGREKDPGVYLDYAAVRLFVERAVAVDPGFRLTRRSAEAIGEVCRQLDGIPLAIEMAAARARSMSAGEIRERLADRFRLLTLGSRIALPRQQTLRAAMEWSYDMLSEPERALLRHLSVFAGGWTLAAAEAVVEGASELRHGSAETLDLLDSLADKSMVIPASNEEETRYRMLETVRQYALERLVESGEERLVRRRHLAYYSDRAEEATVASEEGIGVSRLEAEQDNVRAALDHCERDPEGAEAGMRLAVALGEFWKTRGFHSEGRGRCVALLEHPGGQAPTRLRADLLHLCGLLALEQNDREKGDLLLEEALSTYRTVREPLEVARVLALQAVTFSDLERRRERHEECLGLYRELGDRKGIAEMLHMLGGAASRRGDDAESHRLYMESLAINRALGREALVAETLDSLGGVAARRGDEAEARRLFAETLATYRKLGRKTETAGLLQSMSYRAYVRGDHHSAKALGEDYLELSREFGNRMGELIGLQHLGWVCLSLGEAEEAGACFRGSLGLQREVGRKQELATALDGLSDLAYMEGRWERAVCLWGIAEALRTAYAVEHAEGRPGSMEQKVSEAREAMGEAAFERAWEEGQAMSIEQAIDYGLRL